jgi:hypothetical protein
MFARVGARVARAAVASAPVVGSAVTSGGSLCNVYNNNTSRGVAAGAGALGASLLGRRAGAGGAAAARRGFASESSSSAKEAVKEAMEEPSVIGNVIDGMMTVGTVFGLGVLGAVGVSYYAQTTDELEKAVEKGEHVPAALKGTPLEPGVDFLFFNLVEFRQWADGQAHFFLDPVSDKLLPDHPANASYIPHTLVGFWLVHFSPRCCRALKHGAIDDSQHGPRDQPDTREWRQP